MKKSTNNEEIVVNLPLIPENYEITDYIRKQNGIPSKQSLINFQNVSTGEGVRNFIATTIFQSSEIYEVHTENDTTRRWIIINNNKENLIVKKDKFKCSCPIEEDCIHIKALHLKLMADNPDQYNQHLPDPGSQDIFALQKKLGNKNRKRVNGLEYVMVNNQPSRKKSRIPNQTEEEIVDILDE
uniref:SWIM-type domain-containing protein n=1 Tax=Panagrolaimus sp. JU765 TaxID=591449 RepID=A0AC34R9K4_9BILA